MPKVEQVGRAAEGAVMTEGCGMWPVQTGLRMTKGGRGADYQSISDVVLFRLRLKHLTLLLLHLGNSLKTAGLIHDFRCCCFWNV